MFGDAANPSGETYPAAGPFLSGPQGRQAPRPAPRLGADTEQVLAETLGLSGAEIGKLRDSRLIGG